MRRPAAFRERLLPAASRPVASRALLPTTTRLLLLEPLAFMATAARLPLAESSACTLFSKLGSTPAACRRDVECLERQGFEPRAVGQLLLDAFAQMTCE